MLGRGGGGHVFISAETEGESRRLGTGSSKGGWVLQGYLSPAFHGPALVGEEGARGQSFCSNPDGQKGPELSSTRYDKNGECSTGLLCPRVDHSWSNGGEFCFKYPQLFGDGAWRAAGAAPAPTARPGRGPPRGSGQPWCHPPATQGHCGVTAGPMNSL